VAWTLSANHSALHGKTVSIIDRHSLARSQCISPLTCFFGLSSNSTCSILLCICYRTNEQQSTTNRNKWNLSLNEMRSEKGNLFIDIAGRGTGYEMGWGAANLYYNTEILCVYHVPDFVCASLSRLRVQSPARSTTPKRRTGRARLFQPVHLY